MKIANFEIGEDLRPFIIAEAGINHNGELEKMLEMIQVAKDCGADCIKFQSFKADELYVDKSQTYTYKSQGKEITESMYEMFKRVEVKDEYWQILKNKCDEVGIIFLSTPQNITDLHRLLKVNIPAIKVGSDDFVTIPLLEEYKKTRLPMILSCGMANLEEIKTVISRFENYPVALLLCTSQYPTPIKDINLNKLKTLRQEFPQLILGFSDHTQGFLAACVALGMGARIFEKHFTLSHDLAGPDHWFSSNPEELSEWIKNIKNAWLMLGDKEIKPTAEEEQMKNIVRRRIIAKRNIARGEKLSLDNITFKRSDGGLDVILYDTIINKVANCDILKDSIIKREFLDEQ